MFRSRHRASGLEFASCRRCNEGTRAADAVASFMARLSRDPHRDDWRFPEARRLISTVDLLAPELRGEVFNRNVKTKWLWTVNGLIQAHAELLVNSPSLERHLATFSAKLTMALYREHVGHALPLEGAVYTIHCLNSGLDHAQADKILGFLPLFRILRQGSKNSEGQFEYRFNCDNRSLFAALASLHGNIFIWMLAAADPVTYGFVASLPRIVTTKPGELGVR